MWTPCVKVQNELGVDGLCRVNGRWDHVLRETGEKSRDSREFLLTGQGDLRASTATSPGLVSEGGELAGLGRKLVKPLGRGGRERVVGIAERDGSKRRRSSEKNVTRDYDESKKGKKGCALPELAWFSGCEVDRVLKGVEDGEGRCEWRG